MPANDVTLEGVADLLTIREAAAAVRLSQWVIRQAIRTDKLPAFIPGGKTPQTTGRSNGYRIRKDDLKAWYFGEEKQ